MKFINTKRFSGLLAAALLLSQLTVNAFAADAPMFKDVPTDSPWYEAVNYAVEHDIYPGSDNGYFSPDEEISVREWAVMACNAYGKQVERTEDMAFGEAEMSIGFQEGWIDVWAMMTPDRALTRNNMYEAIFRMEQLPVFDRCRDGQENEILRTAKLNDLCAENAKGDDIMTRGEAAQLIYMMQDKDIVVENADLIEATIIINTDKKDLASYKAEISKLPEYILYEFNAQNFDFNLDRAQVNKFNREYGWDCTGYYVYGSIFVTTPSVVIHEFGHFYHHNVLRDYTNRELYKKEARSARSLLGSYSMKSDDEYFAEVFAYWIKANGSEERLERLHRVAPETYAYFLSLEQNDWHAIGN